jgi:hypothetical protein
MNKFIKTIPTERISYEFLKSLNGLLGLTERELELLSVILDINEKNTKSRKQKENIDCTENRRIMMEKTSIGKENLSRYIKGFRTKGILVKEYNSKFLEINKALLPETIGNKTVQIVMILKIKDNDIQD